MGRQRIKHNGFLTIFDEGGGTLIKGSADSSKDVRNVSTKEINEEASTRAISEYGEASTRAISEYGEASTRAISEYWKGT